MGPVQVRYKLSGMSKFRGRFSLGSGTLSPLSILGLDPLHLFLLLFLLRRLRSLHCAFCIPTKNMSAFSPLSICSHAETVDPLPR